MNYIYSTLNAIDSIIWNYIGFAFITFIGIYLTIKSNFYQFYALKNIKIFAREMIKGNQNNKEGISPIKLYFTALGGSIGIGNLAAVVGTVTIGGPGSLFWLWIASILGSLVKYSEIYLGIKYRKNTGNTYEGGPMYYLHAAFNNKVLSCVVCFFLCIYGVEVYQFLVITDTLVPFLNIERIYFVSGFTVLVGFSALGGIKRLSGICSMLMPPFMIFYMALGIFVVISNIKYIPELLGIVLTSAFTGHAAAGAFAGSSALIAMHYGISRAVYSGDIGIGYDSIVHAQSSLREPEKQARIGIFALFSDSVICTISILIVLCTGVWKVAGIEESSYIARALKNYIPASDIFVAILFFITGFTTITGYLIVGGKCASYLGGKVGRIIYALYAVIAFHLFSFYDQTSVMLIMSVSGGFLMMINLIGIWKLRHQIHFPKVN